MWWNKRASACDECGEKAFKASWNIAVRRFRALPKDTQLVVLEDILFLIIKELPNIRDLDFVLLSEGWPLENQENLNDGSR
jgi:hypothetical protein